VLYWLIAAQTKGCDFSTSERFFFSLKTTQKVMKNSLFKDPANKRKIPLKQRLDEAREIWLSWTKGI